LIGFGCATPALRFGWYFRLYVQNADTWLFLFTWYFELAV
jgi:hypothetical protein